MTAKTFDHNHRQQKETMTNAEMFPAEMFPAEMFPPTGKTAAEELLIREVTQLRGAIARAGFAVMQTSGDWTIHDISKAHERDQKRTDAVISDNIDLKVQVRELEDAPCAAARTVFRTHIGVDVPAGWAKWVELSPQLTNFYNSAAKEIEQRSRSVTIPGDSPQTAADPFASVRVMLNGQIKRESGGKNFAMFSEQLSTAMGVVESSLLSQLFSLFGVNGLLEQWVLLNKAKLQSATLYLKDGKRLYFRVIMNQVQCDDELQDKLTGLDLRIANRPDLKLLPDFDVMLLPLVAEETATQCGFGGDIPIVRYSVEQPPKENR